MPRLKALNRYWKKHPPPHLLIAAYLDYQAPPDDEPAADGGAEPAEPRRSPWMHGMGAIPASDAFRDAGTTADAIAAAERLFFGELTEI